MLNKTQHHLVWAYGLFLGWLLSFLFNGPALRIIFEGSYVNPQRLALAYIIIPVIILLGGKFYNFKCELRDQILKYGIVISFLGTAATMLLSGLNVAWIIYGIVGVMGVFSGFFIAGWACYFVKSVPEKIMPRLMAYVICLGNILHYLNCQLANNQYDIIVLISLYVFLAGSHYNFYKLSQLGIPFPEQRIEPPKKQIAYLMAVMFLLNIGGGLVQSLVQPLAAHQYPFIYALTIILFLAIAMIVHIISNYQHLRNIIMMSMVLIASGLIMLMVLMEHVLASYVLIIAGYAFLDIFLWSFVAKLGADYGSPIKIFTFVMSANLLAVFTGNLMGDFFAKTTQHVYLVVDLSAISTVAAFAVLPLIQYGRVMANATGSSSDEKTNLKPRMNDTSSARPVKSNKSHAKPIEGKVASTFDLTPLTSREEEIYFLMISGLKNKEIAERAQISQNTLKSHARHIYKKLGVKNKRELISLTKGSDD